MAQKIEGRVAELLEEKNFAQVAPPDRTDPPT